MKQTLAFCLAVAAGPALADDDAPAKTFTAILPEAHAAITEQYGFSPAVRAGDFVFLSGVVAGVPPNENGETSAATNEALTAAYDRAFRHIAEILAEAGADWNDVAEMTTYHTDLTGQIDAIMAVKANYVAAPYPAWTAIDVDRLLPDGGLTEIRVTAYAPR